MASAGRTFPLSKEDWESVARFMRYPNRSVADEPTSALDVTVQDYVLRALDHLVASRGEGLIFISHNLSLVGSFCDRILVMYRGTMVEELAAGDSTRRATLTRVR